MPGSLLERCGDHLVGSFGAAAQVRGATLETGYRGGQAGVRRPNLRARCSRLDRHREQGMIEADALIPVDRNDPGLHRLGHSSAPAPAMAQDAVEQGGVGFGGKGRVQQDASRPRGQCASAVDDGAAKTRRDGKDGVERLVLGIAEQGPRDLEREERVPCGDPLDPGEGRSGNRHPKDPAEDVVQLAQVHGTDGVTASQRLGDPVVKTVAITRPIRGTGSEEPADRRGRQSSRNEGQDLRRRAVRPLAIVDGDDDRSRLGEGLQERRRPHRDCSCVRWAFAGRLAKQRDGECGSLRVHETLARLVEWAVEEIIERGEPQGMLRFGRRRGKDPVAALGRQLKGEAPDCRLADACLPLEDEGCRATRDGIEECIDLPDL